MGVDERLSLDAVSEHTLIAVEHRHRYALARRACAGRRVVDLCCGVGYGTGMLAEVASQVVGVDRDAAAIDTAQATVGARTAATFVADDALAYLRRLEPGDVDVVICFEGLEHLPDVDDVAAQLVRLVRGGAGMVVSVPNSATFGEENEFHLTDFDLDRARALFADLPGVTVAFQSHAEGSLIRGRATGPVRAEVALDGEQDLDWANHFLLLAGVDADVLLDPADAALHLAVAPVNHRYMRGLERANRTLQAANGRLVRERLGLGAAGAASAVLRREDELALSREEVRQCRHRIGVLEAELARLADETTAARAERDGYRRAHVAVHSSRLTNLAARVAGHRFPRS
ncbi:class I SAM-dependent methyltransferase [Paraconexibacter antarcticus]|uniref:Class I SAM-dependent methyltransferase n=1 Tax=Paraconexibacter antarcticus TaxID=2949664 RepID=A0ABY5DW33_9ACTN|nr:class I SAM-dependent methyltransferase [Paraconexibacter antarcticus]UTI65072.1 class I SAM-dependent methyltransferase [Paraconexibacter antarcticus]